MVIKGRDGAASFTVEYDHFTPEGHAFAARGLLGLLDATVRVGRNPSTPAKDDAGRTVGVKR
jgi:hypothetical protein